MEWLILGAILALHVALFVSAVVSIAFANPLRRFLEYERGWAARRAAREVAVDGPHGPFVVRILGPGPPRPVALLVHGRSRRASWMLPLADALAAERDVCLFDHVNHGERGLGTSSLGHREAQEVEAVLGRLAREGYERIAVVGVSIGAASSLAALVRIEPRSVQGVVSIGCFDDLDRFLRDRCAKALLPPYLYPLVRWTVGRLARYRIADVRPVDAIARLAVPVLVLHGRHDELVPLECARRLAAAAGVEPVLYEGGHDDPGHPAIIEAVRTFLERVQSPDSSPPPTGEP